MRLTGEPPGWYGVQQARLCAGTALTGEPLPAVRRIGDRVRAGTWSEDGWFEVGPGTGQTP